MTGYRHEQPERRAGNGATAVEQMLERHLRGIPGELSDAVGIRLRAAMDAVQDRTIGSLDGLRSSVAGIEERLSSTLTALGQVVGETPESVRATVEAALGGLRDDLEVIRATPKQVGRALSVVREAVGEIAAAQEAVGARLAELGGDITSVRDQVGERVAALDERLVRLDRLTGVIESLGKKRGFRDLIATEKRSMDQQERFVERLASLGEELAAQTEAVRIGVEEAAAALEQEREGPSVPEDLAEQVAERVTERLSTQVAAALEELKPARAQAASRETRELAKAQHELERASRGMRTELERVRKRMDSWGRARSAPRIAAEVGGLEERVVELEQAVQGDLADHVFERMQGLFDRRFEALIQLIEARIGTRPEASDEGRERRGLFRRGT